MTLGDTFRQWGSTAAERSLPLPCDGVLPDANERYHRAVDVAGAPGVVFRWLCQLRVAPYSYDWIDNGGRRSPLRLTPGLEELAVGQSFMRIFDLAHFETGRSVTLSLRRPGVFPPIAITYAALPAGSDRCRLLARLAVRYGAGVYQRAARALLPAGDFIMMRRQLLNLARLAEGRSGRLRARR